MKRRNQTQAPTEEPLSVREIQKRIVFRAMMAAGYFDPWGRGLGTEAEQSERAATEAAKMKDVANALCLAAGVPLIFPGAANVG